MRAVKEFAEPEERGAVASVMSAPTRFRRFLKDIQVELRLVTWPTRDDLRSTTITVLVTTFFFGFYLGVFLDWPFSKFMGSLLDWGRTVVSGQ